MSKQKTIRFIDLFAGLGGTRIGFEQACKELGLTASCVFTSEIKRIAVETYKLNFPNEDIKGDITKIDSSDIPEFDFLLGGFPCQPFSSAGNRLGFFDTRGTLFFDIERILKEKKPKGFLLENVEGLSNHDNGKTLEVILNNLRKLGYKVTYKIIDSSLYGVPQKRKRTYILGKLSNDVDLDNFKEKQSSVKDILEIGIPTLDSKFTRALLSAYKPHQLHGKSIKDKRGGKNNIHSWDIGLKGKVSNEEKDILNFLLKERRKKHWAEKKNVEWMDGMPLTYDEIKQSLPIEINKKNNLKQLLDGLVDKGYLVYEFPKKNVFIDSENKIKKRVYDEDGKKGYNIVTGKLSFEINQILDPEGCAPTLVATDSTKLAVVDGKGVRKITIREGLRLFGFPESYNIELNHAKAFDLLGNSVVVPVIKMVCLRLLK